MDAVERLRQIRAAISQQIEALSGIGCIQVCARDMVDALVDLNEALDSVEACLRKIKRQKIAEVRK